MFKRCIEISKAVRFVLELHMARRYDKVGIDIVINYVTILFSDTSHNLMFVRYITKCYQYCFLS